MPGYSWGLSAEHCDTGSKLRKIPGSTCATCYALKGRYRFPSVKASLQRRLDGCENPDWVQAMVLVINWHVSNGNPYFRWFDSGDLQSAAMLLRIVCVCSRLPHIKFWLPTQEREHVATARRTYSIPQNLNIRVSDPMIHQNIRSYHKPVAHPTSGVLSRKHKPFWKDLVNTNSVMKYHCPAPLQNNECGSCRACWKPVFRHILYLEH